MPGQRNIGVRNHHRIELGIIEVLVVSALHNTPAITPFPIHGQDEASARTGIGLLAIFRNCVGCQSSSSEDGAGLLQERASIHYLCPLRLLLNGKQNSRRRAHDIQPSTCWRSVADRDSVPRAIDGPIARAWLCPSNQTRNEECSAPASLCWFSQL